MKKLFATTALFLTAAIATPAFAQGSSSSSSSSSSTSSSSGVASTADLACMAAAVNTRESAIITARTSYNAKILTALNTRKTSVSAALTIANNKNRNVALKAAWDTYLKAGKEARAQYKLELQASWKVFVEAAAKCNIDSDRGLKHHSKKFENWFEKHDDDNKKSTEKKRLMIDTATKAKMNTDVNAAVQLDLSF